MTHSTPAEVATPAPAPGIDVYRGSDIHLGGRRASPTYLKAWYGCPFKWFMQYLAPWPGAEVTDDEPRAGLTPLGHTSKHLLMGSLWHAGMLAYRLSGWRDGADSGEYDLAAVQATVQAMFEAQCAAGEWNPEESPEGIDTVQRLLRNYHNQDIAQTVRVLADSAGLPLLEREFQVPIGCADDGSPRFLVCVKPDMLGQRVEGDYYQSTEYKTASARYQGKSAQSNRVSDQAHAEVAALHRLRPGEKFYGVVFEYAVKDRGAKSTLPEFVPDPVTKTEPALDLWRRQTERTLSIIADASANYRDLVVAGVPPFDAAHSLFPMQGKHTEGCWAFFRECEFFTWCHGGFEHGPGRLANSFKPRTEHGSAIDNLAKLANTTTPTPEGTLP